MDSDKPSPDEPSPDQISALIDAAFSGSSIHDLTGATLEHGEALSFSVPFIVGRVQCMFDLKPLAILLLSEFDLGLATDMMTDMINNLQMRLAVGSVNAAEAAVLNAAVFHRIVHSVGEQKTKGDKTDLKEQRAALLKKMNSMNERTLVPERLTSSTRITVARIIVAIVVLMREGKSAEEITAEALAISLKCKASSIYKTLERKGMTLKGLLSEFDKSKKESDGN